MQIMFKTALFATSLLCCMSLGLGCSENKNCDTADCSNFFDSEYDSEPPDTQIDTVGWWCDENAYWFDVYTVGISPGGWLYIYQTGSSSPWNEDHPMTVYDSDIGGHWTRLYLDLRSVYPDATQTVSGSTTLYDCTEETGMKNTLTFVLEVDGNLGTECVAWGDNPDAAPADDCARIEPDRVSQLR